MRLVSASVFLFLLSSFAIAQPENLPDILKPDAMSEAEGQRIGAKVFKLLPPEIYPNVPGSTKDKDNPLGIRGGGSFYSFSTGSHSHNKTPQIRSEQGLLITYILSGISLFRDLGPRDLEDIDSKSPEAELFLTYKPPKLWSDIPDEQKRIEGNTQRYVRATVGNSYLLRSMIWERFDIAVAFKILKKDTDGSLTIAWKQLADFPKPFVLYMPDEELQAKLDAIILEENIIGYRVVVNDNWIYTLGPVYYSEKFQRSLHRMQIRYRGAGGVLR
jgi:hypothetical protein